MEIAWQKLARRNMYVNLKPHKAFGAAGAFPQFSLTVFKAVLGDKSACLPVALILLSHTSFLPIRLPENEQSPSAIETAVVQDFFEQRLDMKFGALQNSSAAHWSFTISKCHA